MVYFNTIDRNISSCIVYGIVAVNHLYSLHLNLGNCPAGTLIHLHGYVRSIVRCCTCIGNGTCRSCDAQCSYISAFIRFAYGSHPAGGSSNDDVFTFHFHSRSSSLAIADFPVSVLHSGFRFGDFAQQVFHDRYRDGFRLSFQFDHEEFSG